MMRLLRRAFRVLRYWLATFGESESERTERLFRQAQACLDELAGLNRGTVAASQWQRSELEGSLQGLLGIRGLKGCGFAADLDYQRLRMQSDLDAQREALAFGEWERLRNQAATLRNSRH